MVTQAHEQLRNWIGDVLPDTQVSFAPPGAERADGQGVSLYLYELRDTLRRNSARADYLQLELAYLVTAWAEVPSAAGQLLIELCFAAMEQPGFEVGLEPPDARTWQAFGAPPQPSFTLRLPWRQPKPDADIQLVRLPLVVRAGALGRAAGFVRTPDGAPVPNAEVAVPALGSRATTDRAGRFTLDGLPAPRDAPLRLRVRARGREVTHEVRRSDDRSALLITLDPTEALNG